MNDAIEFSAILHRLDPVACKIIIAAIYALRDGKASAQAVTSRVYALHARHLAGEEITPGDLEQIGT